jgi:Protein of unknown function (DUF1329)
MGARQALLLGLAAILVLAGSAAADPTAPAAPAGTPGAALKPGDVLGPDNWQKAEGLLPPEVLAHYRKGEYRNRILDWPNGRMQWEPAFLTATKENAGKFILSPQGTILDKATGKQPPFVYGFPFPDIDPKDPQAAVKILWNSYYGYWYLGNSHNQVRLIWVNPDRIDREAGQDVHFLFYDGQSERYRMPNPQNYFMQMISTATYPADLQGTTALTWRYRDPDKRDSNWAYVPALRRVRAVSPSNRSDGFLGSDMSQDDGPFFDGKVEDFDWKLLGVSDTLRLVDPLSLEGKGHHEWLPGGGWRSLWPDVNSFGQQDPNWKGIAWAPIGPQLAKRPMWIIEATPKDKYYLYGKIQLYIDQETYQGAYNRKFSWNGELLNTYYVLGFLSGTWTRPDGGQEVLWNSNMGYQVAENVKANRATVSGLVAPGKNMANDRRVPYDPSFFDFSSLQRFGK